MSTSTHPSGDREGAERTERPQRRDRTHFLYMAVVAAVGLGITVGVAAPDFAVQLAPLGEGFVALIKMMIQPVIFCTIVLGVGSVASAAKVGKVGGVLSKRRMEGAAETKIETLKAELAELEAKVAAPDPARFEKVDVVPMKTGVDILGVGVAWVS